jgi:dCTP deaminase
MILSNASILEALERGWLIIDPVPQPRKPTATGPPCPYQTSAVDLRLGHDLAWLQPRMGLSIDLIDGGFTDLFAVASQRVELRDGQPYRLAPGQLVLGRTLERIELPLPANAGDYCLAARVEGRSSYARCGLLVHFTAPTIHAGFAGTITLEIMNFGPYPILLHAGSPICQLIVERVEGIPFRNDSQFQGQATPGGGSA